MNPFRVGDRVSFNTITSTRGVPLAIGNIVGKMTVRMTGTVEHLHSGSCVVRIDDFPDLAPDVNVANLKAIEP